jgi:hypothetical protein
LEFFLKCPEGLVDVIITNTDLHLISTMFEQSI